MRILDESGDKSLSSIIVYLKREEAEELRDSVLQLLAKPRHSHFHINSEDFKKELTICIYNENDLSGFDERSKRLIADDE